MRTSKTPLVLAVLLAVGVIVYLFASGMLGGGLGGGTSAEDGGEADLLGAGDPGADPTTSGAATPGLASMYGEGDLGAVRLRLLWVGRGEPVVGQLVRLIGTRGVAVAEIPSDQDGVVLFPQVPSGPRFSLHLKGEGFAELMLRGVTVMPGRTKDLGDLLLGKHIVLRGRVVDDSGRPLPNSTVSVHTMRTDYIERGFVFAMAEMASAVPLPLDQTKTDEDGFFAFATLDDGLYRLVARHVGRASKHQPEVLVAKDRSTSLLTMVLADGAVMKGKVVDDEGKPIPRAQVIAVRDEGRRFNMRSQLEREVAETGDDGRYELDTLAIGQRYRVGVLADGYAPLYATNPVTVEQVLEKDFTLPRGGRIEGLVTDEASGKPVAGAEVAVMAGQLGFGGRRRGSGDEEAAGTVVAAKTDPEGKFVIEGLMPGPVMSLSAKAPGYVTASRSMWTQNQLPDVMAGETLDVALALERGGAIEGIVTSAEDGKPIGGARVTVTGNFGMMFTGTPNAVSDLEGRYSLPGGRPGTYTVTASADGFAEGESTASAEIPESGGTLERDVVLTGAGTVHGVVSDLNDEPLAGVIVRVRGREPEPEGGDAESGRRRGGNWMRRTLRDQRQTPTVTDEAGRFEIAGLGPKLDWIVRAEAEGFTPAESKRFRVKVAERKEMNVRMQPGASLVGRAVDENGRWLAGVRVRVGTLDEELARRVNLREWDAQRALAGEVYVTDAEGRFEATDLEAGVIAVRAEKDGYVTYFKRNAKLAPGQQYDDYRIAMSLGETVEGAVLDTGGRPISGAFVAIDKSRNPSRGRGGDSEMVEEGQSGGEDVQPALFSRTEDDGRYRIENVPPGTYSVYVWFAPGHKSYRDESEAAIRRDVAVPGSGPAFQLEEAPAGENMGPRGGGGRGGRGDR